MSKVHGGLLITGSSLAFAYATLWLLFTVSSRYSEVCACIRNLTVAPSVLQPFIEEGQPFGKAFPPPEALFLPVCLGFTAVVAAIPLYIGYLLIRESLGPEKLT